MILDTTITEELLREGLAREMISKIQQMRKQKDFEMIDRIRISYSGDEAVKAMVAELGDYVKAETLADELREAAEGLSEYDLNGHKTGLDVERL